MNRISSSHRHKTRAQDPPTFTGSDRMTDTSYHQPQTCSSSLSEKRKEIKEHNLGRKERERKEGRNEQHMREGRIGGRNVVRKVMKKQKKGGTSINLGMNKGMEAVTRGGEEGRKLRTSERRRHEKRKGYEEGKKEKRKQ